MNDDNMKIAVNYYQGFFRHISQWQMYKSKLNKINRCFITGEEDIKLARHHIHSFTNIIKEVLIQLESKGYDYMELINGGWKSYYFTETYYDKFELKHIERAYKEISDEIKYIGDMFKEIHSQYPIVKINSTLHRKYHGKFKNDDINIYTFKEFFNIDDSKFDSDEFVIIDRQSFAVIKK